jgi:hypothetical protein
MATNAQWTAFDDKINEAKWLQAFNILETIVKDIDARLKSQENKVTNLTARVVALENA